MIDSASKYYSQYREDLVVWECVKEAVPQRLLEIGAWDAVHFSNSRLLIEAGWEAVLVEPSPGPLRGLAQEYGPHGRYTNQVTVVGAAVTIESGPLIKLQVTDDAVSSSESATQETWKEKGGYYGSIWVPTVTIAQLANQFGGGFSFISIDAEGTSVDLLRAVIDHGLRPLCIVCEHDQRYVEVAEITLPHSYRQVALNGTNVVLERRG